MSKINLILQAKGGVGKSLVASILTQYLISIGTNPLCVDLDPSNTTYSDIKALHVRFINIIDESNEVNTRKFDELMDLIAKTKTDMVIDSGSNSFIQLSNYLITNQIPTLVSELGHELVIHTVITGGESMFDTINSFGQLASQTPETTPFIIWLNSYHGKLEVQGKTFEETKAYTQFVGRIRGMITMPEFKKETFGQDFINMTSDKKTFEEFINNERIPLMQRHRMKVLKDTWYKAIGSVM